MNGPVGSTILDTIRDSLKLHVGFCRWSDDVGNLFWACSDSARSPAHSQNVKSDILPIGSSR